MAISESLELRITNDTREAQSGRREDGKTEEEEEEEEEKEEEEEEEEALKNGRYIFYQGEKRRINVC